MLSLAVVCHVEEENEETLYAMIPKRTNVANCASTKALHSTTAWTLSGSTQSLSNAIRMRRVANAWKLSIRTGWAKPISLANLYSHDRIDHSSQRRSCGSDADCKAESGAEVVRIDGDKGNEEKSGTNPDHDALRSDDPLVCIKGTEHYMSEDNEKCSADQQLLIMGLFADDQLREPIRGIEEDDAWKRQHSIYFILL